MNICIVGHGPSPIGKGMGEQIDLFDLVVRLKNCEAMIGTADYGCRTDALCMSTEVTPLCQIPSLIYWLYPKNGKYDEAKNFDLIAKRGAPFMIPLDLCNHWNQRFLDAGGKHPNISTGLAAIVIAAHYYEPELISLVGFDTLLDPTVPFSRNDLAPRTGSGVIQHDWNAENNLLRMIADEYNVDIGVLHAAQERQFEKDYLQEYRN